MTKVNHFYNGLHAAMVKSSILRGLTEGKLPPKQKIDFHIPFNLMKSETLVWVMRDVDYLETVTRRERQGTSDGMSFRVARGAYYRTGTFRSRTIEWNEIIHADTGLLGFTTKHITSQEARRSSESVTTRLLPSLRTQTPLRSCVTH